MLIKKITIGALALCLSAGAMACGDDDETSNNENNTTTPTTPTPTTPDPNNTSTTPDPNNTSTTNNNTSTTNNNTSTGGTTGGTTNNTTNPPAAECGNGIVEGTEVCDGDCPDSVLVCDDNDACTADTISGSAAQCSAVCDNDPITTCIDDDGCCPAGCDGQDNDCGTNPTVQVGSACASDADCGAGGVCIPDADLPGGYCTKQCQVAADCGGDAICLAEFGGQPLCLDGCAADSDCRAPDYECADLLGDGTLNACLPPEEPVMPVEAGLPCAADTDCDDGGTCFTGPPGGYCTLLDCTSDAECAGDGACLLIDQDTNTTACLDGCVAAADCRAGYECLEVDAASGLSVCFPEPPEPTAPGTACTATADCEPPQGQSPFCITNAGYPNGYCTSTCAMDADCGMGGVCQGNFCLAGCTTDADCNTGYSCSDVNGDGTTTCNPAIAGSAAGTTCLSDDQCGVSVIGGFCVTEADNGWTGGYCSGACIDDSDCLGGSTCQLTNPSDPQNSGSICVQSCTANTDCRTPDYECYDFFGGGTNACAPVASGTGPVGGACTGYGSCAGGQDGLCLLNSDFADGYCSVTCTTDADCSAGSHCLETAGLCIDDCTTTADCRANGYECFDAVEMDGVSECWPSGTGSQGTGESCAGVYECDGGQQANCFTLLDSDGDQIGDLEFDGGYCSQACTTDAECGVDGHCSAFGGNVESCLSNCTTDADCRTNYLCVDIDQNGVNECWSSL